MVGREAYRQGAKYLKSHMQRQWSLVGRMAGTFREKKPLQFIEPDRAFRRMSEYFQFLFST